jgi:hypothetical protein
MKASVHGHNGAYRGGAAASRQDCGIDELVHIPLQTLRDAERKRISHDPQKHDGRYGRGANTAITRASLLSFA